MPPNTGKGRISSSQAILYPGSMRLPTMSRAAATLRAMKNQYIPVVCSEKKFTVATRTTTWATRESPTTTERWDRI
mgnify:CR=1 FL=1